MKRKWLCLVLVFLLCLVAGCSSTTNEGQNGGGGRSTQDTAKSPSQTMAEPKEMTPEHLDDLLQEEPLYVTKTKYAVGDEEFKMLYPDMLQAILQNDSQDDIKDAVVAFVAWDKNGLPVKIEGQFDFMGGSYIKEVSYDDINLISGGSFGEDHGFSLSENCEVKEFKAIAVSYETFEGKRWENQYFDEFCDLYEGKKID